MLKIAGYEQSESLYDLVKNPVNLEYLKLINELSQLVNTFGYTAKSVSPYSLSKLNEVPDEKKKSLSRQLVDQIKLIEPCLHKEDQDLKLFERAMNINHLKIDSRMIDTLDKETLIEVYNYDMTQIFRSLNFFEKTSYSILDLMTFEWYHLWKKPSYVTKEYLKLCDQVAKEKLSILKVDIIPYLNLEILNTGLTEPFSPYLCLLTPCHLGNLEGNMFNPRQHFMSTIKATFVTDDMEKIKQTAFI